MNIYLFDSSLFIGQSYFSYDGSQNYLVFQPFYNYFRKIGNKDNISAWKSKGLSEESIKPPTTPNNSPTPSLHFINDKVRVKFEGGCLIQEKITCTYKR